MCSSLLPPFFSSPPEGSSPPPWPPWPPTPACPPSFSSPSSLLPPASLQYTSPSRFLCSLFSHSNFRPRLWTCYSFTHSLARRHLTARWPKPKMTSRRRCEGEGQAATSGRCGASVSGDDRAGSILSFPAGCSGLLAAGGRPGEESRGREECGGAGRPADTLCWAGAGRPVGRSSPGELSTPALATHTTGRGALGQPPVG